MQDSLKLTIVLTLKDRVAFTYRWMRYMNGMRCPYRILIADGGEDSAIEQHLRNYENYPHLDYEYIRYPYDASIEDYYKKFENVISRVESEYLLLADNDDFYLLERIPDMLAFLDRQRDYVGVRGQVVNLTLFDKAGLPCDQSSGVRYLAVSSEALSIESASPFDRVEALCMGMSKYDYYMNWYCIFRSASLREVWKSLITLPIKEVIVAEVLTHVLMVMRGKIEIWPTPFYIRQSNTSLSGDKLVVGNEFLERCIVNNALSEFGVAVDQIDAVQTKEERERVLRAIAAWLEVFVSNIYLEHLLARTSFMFRLRRRIRGLPFLGALVSGVYYRVAHWLAPLQRRAPLRLTSIERYILSPFASQGIGKKI